MSDAPPTWPPLPLAPTGWLALDGTPTVSGPWTEQVRTALRVLDPMPATATPTAVHLRTVLDPDLPVEGYRLSIDDEVLIAAATPDGARQACTTIRQLLPVEAWRTTATRRDGWRLPRVEVRDAPAWPYRGFMLDVSRHFAPVPEVLRWIELAAMHRLNRLHLHLTDDQGWRLPSRVFPALVEVGSWRSGTWIGHASAAPATADGDGTDRTPHGGSYSWADLREITDHAARHGITVVPEVDLPGHASALLAAVPALGVPGMAPQQVATRWGLLGRTISPLPEALGIVRTLLGEVAEAIDSPYLHVGGDEADLTTWRQSSEIVEHARAFGGVEGLRRHVNAELARMVLDLGRTPVAWDDAFVAGGLPTETVVMAWRSTDVGLEAARAGHDVVMAPVMPTYLDYAEATGPDEPLSIGAPLTVSDVAAWTPPPARGDARVLGGQGQLWTEYAPDQAAREYRAFPRLAVLAANLWRGAPTDLADGTNGPALATQVARLDARSVNHRPLKGPHPWQRAGAGARAPVGIHPMAVVREYLEQASRHSEPPPL